MAAKDKEEIRLDKELIKVEEKKQVYYSYKRMKLQHHTVDGITENVYLASTGGSSTYGSSETRYTPDEARALLNVLKLVFPDEE